MTTSKNEEHLNGHTDLPSQLSQRQSKVNYPRLLELGRELLVALGENPDREGLLDTPRRWADAWREFMEYEPGLTETCFASVSADQMICVSGIHISSYCEHHLMPFWCDVAIGYLTRENILGLSKFARIAHQFAHQLQLQERIGQEIADEITRITRSPDVAVALKGEHLCMSARGIRTPGVMTTLTMRGRFRTDGVTQAAFFQMISDQRGK